MIDATTLLPAIPLGLRDPLLEAYREIASNFIEHRWEPSELNGGKFCEVVYTILNGSLKGGFATRPAKPRNMAVACLALENLPADASRIGDESLRVLIPRILVPLYDVRNKRGVGHVGGDVNPNFMDATAVFSLTSWVLAELIRIFHNVSTIEAQDAVDALVERKLPLIWEIGDVRRVLDTSVSTSNQALLLLYQRPGWVAADELSSWVDYSSASMFRTRVLRPLHKARLIEFNEAELLAHISPLGSKHVEVNLLKTRIE